MISYEKNNNLSVYPSGSVFHIFSPLELEIRHFGLENLILREISSLEPDGHVWKPKGFNPAYEFKE